jgi:transcriptional regulator with GAF, ATPase, and Fis domain
MASVWLHAAGEAGTSARPSVADALQSCGVALRPLDADDPHGPGVLLFDDVADELCDLVHRASCGGRERVIAVAAGGSPTSQRESWRLLAAGAADIFAWSHSDTPAAEIAARVERWDRVETLVQSPAVAGRLVGVSPAWRSTLRQVVEIAAYSSAPLLITGETGTGKELVARTVHELDPREPKGELVLVDCTTIVPTLSGSEFFGHERGAFTGAVSTRDGALAHADGGTLFLDEVGELPLALQAELLRAVQEGTFKRVGSDSWRQTRFRLICATNRDLLAQAHEQAFRWDFYYRIAALSVHLPSLRDRPEDTLPLANHFFERLLRRGEPVPQLDPAVREFLLARHYPGNVRDLRHLATRIKLRHVGPGPITLGDLPEEERAAGGAIPAGWPDETLDVTIRRALTLGIPLAEIGSAATDAAVRLAIADERGSLTHAARRLGVTPRALQLRRAARRRATRTLGGAGS